jgi:hypothetical protein
MTTSSKKILSQAVCACCGALHNPHKGRFCEHCGRLYDHEREIPALSIATQDIYLIFLRNYRDYDLAFIALEASLTLDESQTLSAFLTWVKTEPDQRYFSQTTFATRLQAWQNWLGGAQ